MLHSKFFKVVDAEGIKTSFIKMTFSNEHHLETWNLVFGSYINSQEERVSYFKSLTYNSNNEFLEVDELDEINENEFNSQFCKAVKSVL